MKSQYYDVIVIGGGPAGLAASLSASHEGAKTLVVEREAKLGGILKQCIHDGFGLVRFNEKLTGPEYAHRFIEKIPETDIEIAVQTFVTKIEKTDSGFRLSLVNHEGLAQIQCRSLVLATGCRERTSRQIGVHGHHCAGVFSAGTAQYYTNILGKMPTKRCVILGSGDIGLIMARRLTLEGAQVLGVYEAKPTPGGLTRNIYQCLEDFDIPLYTSKTITRLFGDSRISAVEVSDVDENLEPVPGTEKRVECDALILSVGLIPENELAESLGIAIDRRTNGPVADQNCQTSQAGVFCCGNALHVNDLVDYVSETGETAGRAAARYSGANAAEYAALEAASGIQYVVPQKLDLGSLNGSVPVYFRSKSEMGKARLSVNLDGKEIFGKNYARLRPPEMERLELNFSQYALTPGSAISFTLSEAQ
ncbi:MAG: NAD(P)/FAD-dependent oxidoreductase [Treponema sp.]|nr:NAD(P)/FAD-dependent oxidoreductase [Treponema sp.]